MMNAFLDWSLSIKPAWAGYVVFVCVFIGGFFVSAASFIALVIVTNGWALLAIPVLFAYCLFVALFMQGNT
jgi:hypothetical protein